MPSLPRPGDRLAGFRIERELGHGTTGVVYLAHQEGLERKVALKVVGLPLAGDPTFRERFRREARAAAGLDHPNVVQILESGEDDTHLWLAMRLVDGPDLRVLLRRTERLDPEQAVVVVEQIASALDAAHAAGLVHRDVKPGNVLIEDGPARDLHVELADFGLARGAGADAPAGTLGYAAPEQLAGEEAGPAADVFGLGCVLFELLTGESPPAAAAGSEGEDDRPRAHVRETTPEPLRPSDAYPRLGGAFDPTVERATDPDPAKRFATAGELALWARAALSVPRNSMDPPTAAPLRVAAATAALPDEVFAAAPTWEIPPEEKRHGWGRKLLVGLFLVAVLSALGIAFIAIGNSGAPESERRAGATTVTVQAPAARAGGGGSSSAGGGAAGSASGTSGGAGSSRSGGAGSGGEAAGGGSGGGAAGARGSGSGAGGPSGSGSSDSGSSGTGSDAGSGASSGSGSGRPNGSNPGSGGSGSSSGSASGSSAGGGRGSSSRRPSLPVPGARAKDPSGTRTPPLPVLPIGYSRYGGGGWILDLPTGEGWRQTAVQELYGGTRIITRLARPDGARLLVEALPGRTSVLGIPDGRRFPVRLPDAGRTEGALYRGGRFAMCDDGVCAAVAANGPSGGVVVVSGSRKAYGAKRLVRRAAMGLHVR